MEFIYMLLFTAVVSGGLTALCAYLQVRNLIAWFIIGFSVCLFSYFLIFLLTFYLFH